MADAYIGIQTIADYCGVERTAVYQWLARHGPDVDSEAPVPAPAVVLVQMQLRGETKKTYGWSTSSLRLWRQWYASLKGWDVTEAGHRWLDVDAGLRARGMDEEGMEQWLTSL
jgi:hypothetical protein